MTLLTETQASNFEVDGCFYRRCDAQARLRNTDGHSFSGQVHVNDGWETFFWCQAFGCNQDQLRDAVRASGSWASAVRQHFEKHPPASP